MKYGLADCIVNHIFDNFGITLKTTFSIKNNYFLLNEKITFMNELGDEQIANLWGTQVSIDKSNFRIMVADFSNSDFEHALIIKLDGCPTYACYLAIDEVTGDPSDGLISFSLQKNNWLKANASIQGTFLSGMESLKDITGSWEQILKYDDLIEELKSFIEYHDGISSNYENNE